MASVSFVTVMSVIGGGFLLCMLWVCIRAYISDRQRYKEQQDLIRLRAQMKDADIPVVSYDACVCPRPVDGRPPETIVRCGYVYTQPTETDNDRGGGDSGGDSS